MTERKTTRQYAVDAAARVDNIYFSYPRAGLDKSVVVIQEAIEAAVNAAIDQMLDGARPKHYDCVNCFDTGEVGGGYCKLCDRGKALAKENIDWTGASWVFTDGPHVDKRVIIIRSKDDPDFGPGARQKVWIGEILGVIEKIEFTHAALLRDLDPKTMTLAGKGHCA